jgi:hypothetical protein
MSSEFAHCSKAELVAFAESVARSVRLLDAGRRLGTDMQRDDDRLAFSGRVAAALESLYFGPCTSLKLTDAERCSRFTPGLAAWLVGGRGGV